MSVAPRAPVPASNRSTNPRPLDAEQPPHHAPPTTPEQLKRHPQRFAAGTLRRSALHDLRPRTSVPNDLLPPINPRPQPCGTATYHGLMSAPLRGSGCLSTPSSWIVSASESRRLILVPLPWPQDGSRSRTRSRGRLQARGSAGLHHGWLGPSSGTGRGADQVGRWHKGTGAAIAIRAERLRSGMSRRRPCYTASRLTASGSAARQYWSNVSASRKASAPYRPTQTVTAASAS